MSIKEQEIDAIFQEIEQESKESDIIEEIKQKLPYVTKIHTISGKDLIFT
ncbi:hypothetical protein HCR15_03330 [Wolbachia pipientis]|nr:hypothetical protein [Wolbachia pipientis]MBA8756130.1 hypothetical protein [Wolbachia pipientis]